MFNNLAAYLLGTSTNHQQPSRADEESTSTIYGTHHHHHHQHQQHHQQQLNSIRLTSSSALPAVLPVDVSDDEEDDWVLVDRDAALQQGDNRDSEGNSTVDSSSSEEEESDNEQSPAKISNTSACPPDFDITHLLLPSTANTSPIHSISANTSYQQHLLNTPTAYTRNQLSSTLSATQQQTALPAIVSNTMEESWFLTPPPCFTSTGPVHMETSPLENLLIEHPSMSVYQNVTVGGILLNGRASSGVIETATQQGGNISSSIPKPASIADQSSTSSATVVLLEEVSSDLEDEAAEALLFEVDEEVERGYLRAAQQQQRRRRGNGQRGYNRVAAGEVIRYQQQRQERHLAERHEQQGIRNKQAQKVQIHRACQSLKRSYLERNNKAREVNFRNQRLRRGERSQGSTRSNANNNRKCC